MANTFTGRHRAVVKETAKGTPFIVFEVTGEPDFPGLEKASIGMILDKSADYDDAVRIAGVINEKLVGLYLTNF